MHSTLRAVFALVVLPVAACVGTTRDPSVATLASPASRAPLSADTVGALEAQRAWWRAFTVGDTAYINARTAPALSLTLSSGRVFDRAEMLSAVAGHSNLPGLRMEFSDEKVEVTAPGLALVTAHFTESEGLNKQTFRYLTTLTRHAAGWQVAAGQSTRVALFTPRASTAVAGRLAEYAGDYRTPRGLVLRIVVRDTALALIEPSGAELPMEPIGPGIFEFTRLSPSNGIVRFVFNRDTTGVVAGLTRLVPGSVTTFPRVR